MQGKPKPPKKGRDPTSTPTALCPTPPATDQDQHWLRGCLTSVVTQGPILRRPYALFNGCCHCIEIPNHFEQGPPHFHFALGELLSWSYPGYTSILQTLFFTSQTCCTLQGIHPQSSSQTFLVREAPFSFAFPLVQPPFLAQTLSQSAHHCAN